MIDLMAFLPFGFMANLLGEEHIKFLWVIKAIRISQLNYYLRDHLLNPLINQYVARKQKKYLDDPKMRNDTLEDHVFL